LGYLPGIQNQLLAALANFDLGPRKAHLRHSRSDRVASVSTVITDVFIASDSSRPILLKNSSPAWKRFLRLIEMQPKIRGKPDAWRTERF
jgi:hypothetical protein